MNTIILFIKGLIIGIGKIIPGVSGAVLAIILNVYDEGLNRIVNIFNDFRKNIFYLISIGLGICVGIVLFSNVINYFLGNYYVITMLFFVGLILGGILNILKEVDKRDYIYVIVTILFFCIISFFNINNDYIIKNNFYDYVMFYIGGVIEVCGTVIPGVSSTALLLILGIYDDVIVSIGNISNFLFNYRVLFPFGLGIICSFYFVVKFISICLNKHKKKTYSVILGLVISSVIVLVVKIFFNSVLIFELIIGLIFMIIGIVISNLLG